MKLDGGTVWMNLGLLLLAAALFLAAFNRRESYEAQQISMVVMEKMSDALWQTEASEPTAPGETAENRSREMPVRTIDGRDYIGVLTIPALDLELPVLSRWDNAGLKTAPCRYQGSVYDGSLIICAHNYSSHFGRLKDLREGDRVLFTDMDDHVYCYKMVGLETLNPTDHAQMEGGDWDLTLFTCTVGGQTRVTVRLERDEQTENLEE